MKRTSLLLVCSLLLLNLPGVAKAQEGVRVASDQVNYLFGEYISFEATFDTPIPIQEARVFFRAEDQNNTEIGVAEVETESQIFLLYDMDAESPVRAFRDIVYWYVLVLEDDEIYESPQFSFYYEDNRFEWQNLEGEAIHIHWYQGDIEFAQAILDAAQNGVQHTREFITLPPPQEIDVYVYANSSDMREALRLVGQSWIAGHADPQVGVALVSLAPGPEQALEMEREVPHELVHIMLYQATGEGYANIPVWLNEGLASVAELYPNPDYRLSLESAYQDGTLLPMTSLCDSFPADAARAALAYAEATSFVRFLHQKYGSAGLQSLVEHYATGVGCDSGPVEVFGLGLKQLDRQWHMAAFAGSTTLTTLSEFLPWLGVLAFTLMAPFGWMLLRLWGNRNN